MRTFMGFKRTVCDCELCRVNCRFIPGYLLPEDLIDMASFLGHVELFSFAEEHLLASPGALVAKACPGAQSGFQLLRIRTLVPARADHGWCKFFDGNLCRIHPVAPFGCAFFDSHQNPRYSRQVSAAGLTCIAENWLHESHSIYCQMWRFLQSSRLIAPAPEECRRKMHAHCAPPNFIPVCPS